MADLYYSNANREMNFFSFGSFLAIIIVFKLGQTSRETFYKYLVTSFKRRVDAHFTKKIHYKLCTGRFFCIAFLLPKLKTTDDASLYLKFLYLPAVKSLLK